MLHRHFTCRLGLFRLFQPRSEYIRRYLRRALLAPGPHVPRRPQPAGVVQRPASGLRSLGCSPAIADQHGQGNKSLQMLQLEARKRVVA